MKYEENCRIHSLKEESTITVCNSWNNRNHQQIFS